MKKKKIAIAVGIVVLVFSAGLLLVFRQKLVQKNTGEQISSATATPSPKEELVLWEDPAGFSFQYPKGLTVDKHDEDTENYAHVELTSTDNKGRVIVWVKDTTATTIAQWLKNDKSLKDAVSVDTTLGGNEAKKVMVKDPTKKQITATLDEDVLVLIETELDEEGFWQKVNDGILGSMTFSTTPKNEMTGGNSGAFEQPPIEADEEESVE